MKPEEYGLDSAKVNAEALNLLLCLEDLIVKCEEVGVLTHNPKFVNAKQVLARATAKP